MVKSAMLCRTGLLLLLAQNCRCEEPPSESASSKPRLGAVSVGDGRGIPYKWVSSNNNNYLFWDSAPYGYVNITGTQSQAVAAIGNAALLFSTMLLLGRLPVPGKLAKKIDHRFGHLLPRPEFGALRPPKVPRLKRPQGFRRPRPASNRRKPMGPRRLRKKSGAALRDFTYRRSQRPSHKMEAPPMRRNRHYPKRRRNPSLPLPPMSDVVTRSVRKKFRPNRQQPVRHPKPTYNRDSDFGVIEPVKPQNYYDYDNEDYEAEEYINSLPARPPTRRFGSHKTSRPRYGNYGAGAGPVSVFEDIASPGAGSRKGQRRRYPYALGSTATSTTVRPPPVDNKAGPALSSNSKKPNLEKAPKKRGEYFDPSINIKVPKLRTPAGNPNKKHQLNSPIRMKRRRLPSRRKKTESKENAKDYVTAGRRKGGSGKISEEILGGEGDSGPFGFGFSPSSVRTKRPGVGGGGGVDEPDFFNRPEGFDPFDEMTERFDGDNDEWITSISKAFEDFSDFKKIHGKS